MTRFTPQWLQSGSYAASQDRRLIGALWPGPASAGCAVTVGGGMTLNIAAGQVAVPSQNNTGSTLCASDALEQIVIPAAPPSNQNRVDLVVCQPRGTDLDGGANNDWIWASVQGAVATSPAQPTPPAAPAGSVAVYQVYVPGAAAALVAGNLTDVRPGGLGVPPASGTGSGPRGHVASFTGPGTAVSLGSTLTTVFTLAVPLTAGRRYRLNVYGNGNQQTAAGTGYFLIQDNASYISARVTSWTALAVSGWATGSYVGAFAATATASVTFTLSGLTSAGTFSVPVNSGQMVVEDIGST